MSYGFADDVLAFFDIRDDVEELNDNSSSSSSSLSVTPLAALDRTVVLLGRSLLWSITSSLATFDVIFLGGRAGLTFDGAFVVDGGA